MRIAPLLLASLVAACGGSSTPPPRAATPTAPADDPSCPVTVPGTSVTVEDTHSGGALVFVTTGDAAEVRMRVAAMAAMHNEHHASMGPLPTGDETGSGGHSGHDMGGHGGHQSGGAHSGHAGGMISVHSQAKVEDIDGGARLVFIAMPDGIGTLQSELRMHAQHLSSGTCAMPASHHAADKPDGPDGHDGHTAAPKEPPPPDPAQVKADLLAAETAAYQAAKPVFDQNCASCHAKGGRKATAKKMGHFDMTAYPFGGHHAGEMGATMRKVLAIGGGKATMPKDKPGSLTADELAKIAAWADAFDASHAGGAHEGQPGHEGHGGGHDHGGHKH